MIIVLSTDANYVMPTGVLMTSIGENNEGENIKYYVLVPPILPEKYRESLRQTAERYGSAIEFIEVSIADSANLPVKLEGQPEYISIEAYYRLFLASLLPSTVDKVLYLDGDIVCRDSLAGLWATDLMNCAVAAVYEIENGDGRYERLGFPYEYGYFNSGVMLVNLKYWRDCKLESAFLDYLSDFSDRVVYHDQDVLNALLFNKKKKLDVRFNVLNSYYVKRDYSYRYPVEEISAAREEPVIVHFSSHMKPWFKGCNHPFVGEFLMYKQMSLWERVPLRMFKAQSLKGCLSNVLVFLGISKYKGNYIGE